MALRAVQRSWWRRLTIALPLFWLLLFFVVPFAIIVKLSLSQTALAQPPYVPIFDLAAGWSALVDAIKSLSFDNYRLLFSDDLYVSAYLRSVQVAALSTFMLLIVGMPVAYAIARAPRHWQAALLVAVVLPFLTAFLIRIYAWLVILQREGLLNELLFVLGLIDAPVTWLASDAAVYLGIVYSYLPFMILPIYAGLAKMDGDVLDAAADLGCTPIKTFWLVIFPLARPAIAAGALLCFIPIVGEFVVPDLLGGSDSLMIGQVLWTEFFANRDWPVASALAAILLAALVLPLVAYQHLSRRQRDGFA